MKIVDITEKYFPTFACCTLFVREGRAKSELKTKQEFQKKSSQIRLR